MEVSNTMRVSAWLKRTASWMLSLALLAPMMMVGTAGSVAAEDTDPHVTEEFLTPNGRTYIRNNALMLYFTNSGFAFNFSGTGATLKVSTTFSGQFNDKRPKVSFLNVYVDGGHVPSKVLTVTNQDQVLTLAENLPAGDHSIKVVKRNQADFYSKDEIAIKEVQLLGDNAEWKTPPTYDRQIEIIGDSITCGQANMLLDGASLADGTNMGGDANTYNEDGTLTYGGLITDAFGAANQTLSRSGMRYIRQSPDIPGSNNESWINYYTKWAQTPLSIGNSNDWAFDRPSDVVIINLGTNDDGCGIVNGTAVPARAAYFQSEAKTLLELVRKHNPDAIIIWTYGMMTENPRTAAPIKAAVEELNDDKIFYFGLNNSTGFEGVGGGHPTVMGGIDRSYELIKFIAEKTGWDYDLRAQTAGQAHFLPKADADLSIYHGASPERNDVYQKAIAYLMTLTGPDELLDQDTQAKAGTDVAQAAYRALVRNQNTGGNKSALAVALALDESRYTEESLATPHYAAVKALATAVNALADTSYEMLAYTLIALNAEQALLVRKDGQTGVDKRALEEALKFDESRYTADSLNADAYQDAKTAAESAMENAEATQAEVDKALADLLAAQKALVPKPDVALGDIDGNGKVDTTDARLALQYAVEKITLTENQLLAGDVDASGKVDTTDARLILQYAVEKIDKFPAEK